jgi:Tfp pilus assembly protein PilF
MRVSRLPLLVALGTGLVVAAGALGLSLRHRTPVGDYEKAIRDALATGRLDDAAKVLERWLRFAPGSAAAHFFKAQLASIGHDAATAEREWARARELGYSTHKIARQHGLFLAQTTRPEEAEPLLIQVFEDSGRVDAEVAEALVKLLLGGFRLQEAARVLDQWSRAAPRDARPFLLLTEIDIRSDEPQDTLIAHYRAALERDPGLSKARLGLAEQLRLNHHCDEAAREYAAYIGSSPSDPVGYVGAAQNAVEMANEAEAVRLLGQALALDPHNAGALAARSAVEVRAGRLLPALGFLDQAIAQAPFDYGNHYQRMLVLSKLGRKAEAVEERKTVERIKRDETRFAEISRNLRINPLDAPLRGEAARWLMDHGHEEEAADWARLVLRTDPANTGMNRLLAGYYRKRGQTGLANFYDAQTAQTVDGTLAVP